MQRGDKSVECGVVARDMPNQICRKQMSGVYVTSATAHETKRYELKPNDTTRCGEPNETKHPLSVALSALRECCVCVWSARMRIFNYSPEPSKDHMIDAYPVRIGRQRVYSSLS